MPYKLTTKIINQYICRRIKPVISGQTHQLVSAELSEDGTSIKLTDYRGRKEDTFIITTRHIQGKEGDYDRVEMSVEPHKPGIEEEDFKGFLEKMVDNDQMFQQKMPFYGHCIPSDTLRRETGKRNRMICSVIDEKAGQERVQKAIYDYMVRPCLYYILKAAGQFPKDKSDSE